MIADHATVGKNHKFETLTQYLLLAKKTISKFGPKFYNGLSNEMLKNPDAVSDVATAIMSADWKFDPDRVGKSGEKKTLYSYRNQCALWAIKSYVSNKYKKKKNMSLDFEIDTDSQKLRASIKDERAIDPLEILIENESTENLSITTKDLLSSNLLTDKQRDQIRMYYFEDQTLGQIGETYNVSREAIRQNIKRAIEIIKSYDQPKS